MNADLCRVEAEDGIFLDGVLTRPADGSTDLPVDACVLVHGTGSNFYAPGVLEAFAAQARASGLAVLRINTRGHDGLCSLPAHHGSIPGGAAYEDVSDCVLDLWAWLDWLQAQGYQRILLVGHSMGGVKSLYTMARRPHPLVTGVVGISPPRFCHEHFRTHPAADAFREDWQRATELVEQGYSQMLMAVRQPMPFVYTAAGFLSKYGPEDKYDYLSLLPAVTLPVLIVLGTETVAQSPAFDTQPQMLSEIAQRQPTLAVELVEGATIHYSTAPERPFELFREWCRTW